MRINRLGQAIHGRTTLALDGRALLPGIPSTIPVWLWDVDGRPSEAIYQVQRGGRWYPEACDVATAATRRVELRPGEIDDLPGAQIEASGEGTYAVYNAAGIRSNVHPTLPLAGLWGMGRDGALAYCRVQQQGTGLIFRSKDGSASAEFAAGVGILSVHALRFGVALYTSRQDRLFSVGLPTPVTVPERVGEPRLVRLANGDDWITYHTDDRLLLHPLEEPIGRVVWDGPNTFAPDLVEIRPGIIRVAWSTTDGAGPGRYRVLDVDTAAPRVPLTRVEVPPIAHPIWTGSFFALSARYGSDLTAPGTCTVIVESGLTSAKPVILADQADGGGDLLLEWKSRWSQILAIYVARESSPGLLTAAIADVRHRVQSLGLPARPILAYSGDTPPVSSGADWIGVQAYPNPGESVADAEHRWRNTLQRVAGRPTVLICGAFDRRTGAGPLIAPDVLEACQARYPELARTLGASCKGLLWFATNRPGGTKDYPALLPWHVKTVAAVQRPVLAPVTPTAVTIARYTTAAKVGAPVEAVAVVSGQAGRFLAWRSRARGASAWRVDVTNALPDLDHHFRFARAGTYEIGVDILDANRQRLDGTASPRLVTVTP